jgi:hypothetical protein
MPYHVIGQPGVHATRAEADAEVERLQAQMGIKRDAGPAKRPARANNIPEPTTDPDEPQEGVMTQ